MSNKSPKKKTTKVKKYAAGGDLRSAPSNPDTMPLGVASGQSPFMPLSIGGSGGAYGAVEDISNSAMRARGELDSAKRSIGGSGGGGFPTPPTFPGLREFKKGGKVRGAGKASKGVRPAKMVSMKGS